MKANIYFRRLAACAAIVTATCGLSACRVQIAVIGSTTPTHTPTATASAVPTTTASAQPDDPTATTAPTATPTGAADTQIVTWSQENGVKDATGSIADDEVRQSPFYSVRVASTKDEKDQHEAFTYLSIPRNGEGKRGYSDNDGAEYASASKSTMSWSSFEYSTDAYVYVSLDTGQKISSVDEVTIRPTSDNFEKKLVDDHTVRVTVPASANGYRFSVEFAPQLLTTYANAVTGYSTDSSAGPEMETEPQNSMLIFAQPFAPQNEVPTAQDGKIQYVTPGDIAPGGEVDLDNTDAEILYFQPGTYWMGSKYRAMLPESVRWVYLAPGAFVKGAFQFSESDITDYKVTGYGVLSGEQYGYETDTANNYEHRVADNCHGTCVKMLQFASTSEQQNLELSGVTIKEPPYHSFVVYGDEDAFQMDVHNYQQVGSWYWQTDGIELYKGSTMHDTFFHANDDVLKLYHSDLNVKNTVIWKNENGPVFQWGWTPRNIDNVTVENTDVIHSRMYHGGQGMNTCVFNSSSHYTDMSATNTADISTTVKNMKFINTHVEGTVNCAIRIFALSNMENIEIDGLYLDGWNGQSKKLQQSDFKLYTDKAGNQVKLGNEMTDGNGLLIHNYRVGDEWIYKAGDNWADTETGRLNFDADTWDGWNATVDGEPQGAAPRLQVSGITDGETVSDRNLTLRGTTNARTVQVVVNGETTKVNVRHGKFTAKVQLGEVENRVKVVAKGRNGVMTVNRYQVFAFGSKLGEVSDPVGDDNGPGSYQYPTDSAFKPGSMDLTGLQVYRDGDEFRFVTSVETDINNPWGGNQMSIQRLNVYLRSAAATDETTTALLPGTNTFAQGAWDYVLVGDGRNESAQYGPGAYDASGKKVSTVSLSVVGNRIVLSVPASALSGVDPQQASYQVSMFSSSEDGEAVGNVRPVFSADCFTGKTCESWVGQYRLGGGKGELLSESPYDSDTSDSNAIDMITGDVSQAEVMSLDQDQVVVPYVQLHN